jgi:hypothetical protein
MTKECLSKEQEQIKFIWEENQDLKRGIAAIGSALGSDRMSTLEIERAIFKGNEKAQEIFEENELLKTYICSTGMMISVDPSIKINTIKIQIGKEYYYPQWQFHTPFISEVIVTMDHLSDAEKIQFFMNPNDALYGMTPIDILNTEYECSQNNDWYDPYNVVKEVIKAAKTWGDHGA